MYLKFQQLLIHKVVLLCGNTEKYMNKTKIIIFSVLRESDDNHIVYRKVSSMLVPRREDERTEEIPIMINNVSVHSDPVYHEIKKLILYVMTKENTSLQFLDHFNSVYKCDIHLLLVSSLLCSTVYVDLYL